MGIHFKIQMSGFRSQARLKPIVQASQRNHNRNFRIRGSPQMPRTCGEQPYRRRLQQQFTNFSVTDYESCPLGFKAKHLLASCPVYQGETINQRWEVVRENRKCWKCLEVSHHRNDYQRADGTSCDKCKENHFRSLHNEMKNSNLSPYAPTFTSQGTPPEVKNCNIRGRGNEETKDVNYFPGICPVLKVRSEAATEHSAT